MDGSPRTSRAVDAGIISILTLLTLAVFRQVSGHRFLIYDDGAYVYGNPHVRAGLTWEGVRWAFTSNVAANWHPVTWFSHMLDVELFGQDAGLHHLSSVGFHLLAVILAYLVFRKMTGKPWASALVAALFGIHPLHVESVAWVAERKDVLSGLGFFLTILFYLRWLRRPSPAGLLSVAVVYLLTLMAKPMAVTLPFVLLLLDFWPLNRWGPAALASPPGSGATRSRRDAAGLALEKLPLFLLSLGMSVITYLAQSRAGAVVSLGAVRFPYRLANAFVSYFRYLEKTFRPAGLAFFYPYPAGGHPAWKVAGAAGAFLSVSMAVLVLRKKQPYLFTGWFWYAGMLVPVIGLVQVGEQAMADRYSYLPLVGIFAALAWGLPRLLAARLRRRLPAIGVAAVLLLAMLARKQVSYWRDNTALFGRAVAVSPGNVRALSNLGIVQLHLGNVDEGVRHYGEAARLEPDDPAGFYNLGNYYLLRGEPDKAVSPFLKALELDPGMSQAWNNLGTALSDRGELARAADCFRHAVRQRPDYAEAHFNLGTVLTALGKTAEAEEHYREAFRLNPALAGEQGTEAARPAR